MRTDNIGSSLTEGGEFVKSRVIESSLILIYLG